MNEGERLPATVVYQWANEKGINGMARPAYLESIGFVKVRQHPNYPLSWLMKKATT